jgi:uncharacterized protein with NRDE domain
MCLIAIALGASQRHPLLLAANRDERHARPTSAAAWWPELPGVLAGRDLEAGGTWLGVDRRGRVAAVTNIREPHLRPTRGSRGTLVTAYLAGEEPAELYAARAADARQLGPFNLLLAERGRLHYSSNRASPALLGPGLHAFSNAGPGADWPKVASVRAGTERLLAHGAPLEPLFELLGERSGAGPQADHFIVGPHYGTRCSTVVLCDASGRVTFAERSFDADGKLVGETRETFMVEDR